MKAFPALVSRTTLLNVMDPISFLSRYLQDHAGESVSLAEMSRLTGYSPFHLQRQFKAALGLTPKQFQLRCRTERLKSQLRHDPTVTQALYEAGYGSSSRLYERIDSDLGMTPAEYRASGSGVTISYLTFANSLGHILLAATDRGLCRLDIDDHPEALSSRLHAEFPRATIHAVAPPFSPLLEAWLNTIRDYLHGRAIDPSLPFDIRGTAFQARVWVFLRQIPSGETRSYSEVAAAIGQPSATRAVANACGQNPVALAIPCHRVIRGNGALGGYRWGLQRKQLLLDSESSRSPR
jgi:AraC family transcriptional regulator of adaptative response/methylated-DNA-[protein]-cysteine methyltransferase